MNFASQKEMLAYEEQREKYYMEYIKANVFKLYKLLLRDIFVRKYRLLKKEYDNYIGGWYRDQVGIIHANHIWLIDIDKIKDDEICIDKAGWVYIFRKGSWTRIY